MITDKVGIRRADPMNIIVFELKIAKRKDTLEEYETESTYGYYNRIESAIKGAEKLLETKLESRSIKDLINEIKALRDSINRLVANKEL